MIALYRLLWYKLQVWLDGCRIDGCRNMRVTGPVCAQHYGMWYDHMYAAPMTPMDFKAGNWSLHEWVRDVNAGQKGGS